MQANGDESMSGVATTSERGEHMMARLQRGIVVQDKKGGENSTTFLCTWKDPEGRAGNSGDEPQARGSKERRAPARVY